MANFFAGTWRRTVPLILGVSVVAFVAAACAEEDPAGTDDSGLPTTESGLGGLGTPDTLGSPDTMSTPSSSGPDLGTPSAGATPAGGSLDDMTLDDIQSFIAEQAPDLDPTAITAVDLSDGVLTVETSWDATSEADATELCGHASEMGVSGAFSSVEVVGADGSTLAQC